MSQGASEAEGAVRIALAVAEGSVKVAELIVIQIGGPMLKEITAYLAALAKKKRDVPIGKSSLRSILARGETIKVTSIPRASYKQFKQKARTYGLGYAKLRRPFRAPFVEVMTAASSVELLNRSLTGLPSHLAGTLQPDAAAERSVGRGVGAANAERPPMAEQTRRPMPNRARQPRPARGARGR